MHLVLTSFEPGKETVESTKFTIGNTRLNQLKMPWFEAGERNIHGNIVILRPAPAAPRVHACRRACSRGRSHRQQSTCVDRERSFPGRWSITLPKPSQSGRRPWGLLKLNSRGSMRGNSTWQASHSNCWLKLIRIHGRPSIVSTGRCLASRPKMSPAVSAGSRSEQRPPPFSIAISSGLADSRVGVWLSCQSIHNDVNLRRFTVALRQSQVGGIQRLNAVFRNAADKTLFAQLFERFVRKSAIGETRP